MFIELTSYDPAADKIWVNITAIHSFARLKDAEFTCLLSLHCDQKISVKETPEEIIQKIKEAKNG